jgi:hypothetical protein
MYCQFSCVLHWTRAILVAFSLELACSVVNEWSNVDRIGQFNKCIDYAYESNWNRFEHMKCELVRMKENRRYFVIIVAIRETQQCCERSPARMSIVSCLFVDLLLFDNEILSTSELDIVVVFSSNKSTQQVKQHSIYLYNERFNAISILLQRLHW